MITGLLRVMGLLKSFVKKVCLLVYSYIVRNLGQAAYTKTVLQMKFQIRALLFAAFAKCIIYKCMMMDAFIYELS